MFSPWYILPAYFFAYLLVSFFFSWKIIFISKDDWNKATLFAFLAEFMFAGATLIAAFYSTSDMFLGEQIGYIFSSAFLMALGTGVATLIVGKINKKKKQQDKTSEPMTVDDKIRSLEKEIREMKNEK